VARAMAVDDELERYRQDEESAKPKKDDEK
jgi:hypothetical protein